MTAVKAQIQWVAHMDLTVLGKSDTGTGKKRVAGLIHEYSPRASEPCIALDCGVIPDSHVESELFGSARGVSPALVGKRPGDFEMAKGGTLFIDGIVNLLPTTQIQLSRSLQECRILRVGRGIKSLLWAA